MFKLPKVVEVDLHDLIDNDLDNVLDLLSKKATGSPLLMDITYRVVGCKPPSTLYIEVDGDDSEIEEPSKEEDPWACPGCGERGEPQETRGNGDDRHFFVRCVANECTYDGHWRVPFTEEDRDPSNEEGWPSCGVAGCEHPSLYVDSAGLGYCDAHAEAGLGNLCLATVLTDFDPWWAQHDNPRFTEMSYGVWPEGVVPPENARPGWGLSAGPPERAS